jgi:hypothetical protein
MREDIKALMDCEAIYLLAGWRESEGSSIEAVIALKVGLKRVY